MGPRRDRAVGHPPEMLAGALALLAGAVLVQGLTELPPRWVDHALTGMSLAGLAACWRWRAPAWLWCVPIMLLAFGWTAWRADVALAARLPHALEKQDVIVTGRVVDLPQVQEGSTRFAFAVRTTEWQGRPLPVKGEVRLSWFASRGHLPPEIAPCTTWRLRVRMKRPHGLVNPGGFDSERSSLQKGIIATGYVREAASNAMLRDGACVDGLRARLGRAIVAALPEGAHASRLLRALSIGDERALDDRDWRVIRATGIPHLIAIAGLQIGIAAVFGVWFARGLWWTCPALATRIPRPLAEAALAFPAALAYALLAGFGLPAMRALVMLAAVAGRRLVRRGGGFGESLGLALVVILAFDPLAVLSAGFWLSFMGVAMLAFTLAYDGGWRGRLKEIGVSPLLVGIALLPLTDWFFGQASLIGPIANLVAAPLVCFVIVPMDLAGCVLLLAWPAAGAAWMRLCAWPVDALWGLLSHLAAWRPALQYLPEVSLAAFVLASIGTVWLVAPRGVPARALGALMVLPLCWPRTTSPVEGAFHATVIDVGQGLSVLVRTRTHALLFDTGARYPSGFDLGDAVVVPTLHAEGVARLDAMIISHGDSDHAGGAVSVLAGYPGTPAWGGEPARGPVPMRQCLAGQRWRWDGVDLAVLHPSPPFSSHDNDVGCVLLVSGAAGRLLLPADTSSRVEPDIARAVPAGPPLVLVAPHHGSKTSSSAAYLEALAPRLAIASTGYLNGYRHPAPVIAERYASFGIPLLNTPDTGAVRLEFPADAPPRVISEERTRQARYWRERARPDG
ncbi:MAG TPA: DNA internalization-related competence protein ComEC/Rec2 [Rhodanobacteraceae bacterium]|nr:DNA internalization-related competence protein ComEC/Rec2 [Rhodanobacteraceae bacterium]